MCQVKTSVLISLFLVCFFFVQSKNNSHQDTTIVNELNRKAQNFYYQNTDSSYFYAQKLLAFSKANEMHIGTAYAYLLFARLNAYTDTFTSGIIYIDSIFNVAKSSGDFDLMTYAHYACGTFYEENSKLTLAEKSYIEVIRQVKDSKSNFSNTYRTHSQLRLASIYAKQGSFQNSFDVCKDLLNTSLKDSEDYDKLNSTYLTMANCMVELDLPNYKEMFEKALEYAIKMNNEVRIAIAESNLGYVYSELGEHERGEQLLHSSHKLFLRDGYPQEIGPSYINIGNVCMRQKKFRDAINNAQMGLETLKGLEYYDYMVNGYEVLFESYVGLKNIDSLNYAYKQFSMYKDSVKAVQLAETKERMYAEYKLDIADQKNEDLQLQNKLQATLLQKKNTITTISVVFSIMLLAALVISFWLYKKLKLTANELTLKNLELQELGKKKVEILSIIGHDLRNPIAQMLQLETAYNRQFLSEEERLTYSGSVIQSIENGLIMLDNILIWASGYLKGEIILKAIEIQPIVSIIQKQLAAVASKKQIEIVSEIENYKVLGNPQLIEIVVRNIVNNAIKFSRPGTKITMESKIEKEWYLLRIIDCGIGMPQEIKEQINSSYTGNIKSAQGTAKEHGSGIGLSLSKEFAAKMNAKIEVESSTENGTIMCFKLKLSA